MLPEPSETSRLVQDMREVQGWMLELERLTSGHIGPLTPPDRLRVDELRRNLSGVSSDMRAEVDGTLSRAPTPVPRNRHLP